MHNLLWPGKRVLAYYIIFWFFCTLVHFAVLHRYFELGLQVSLADALLTNLSLFALLLPLWFVARFQKKGKKWPLQGLFNAFGAGALLLIAWYIGLVTLLESLVHQQETSFFQDSLLFRALFGVLIAFVVYSSFLAFHMLKETREAGKRESELLNLVQRTELQALKNQLNPHFIYNGLNAISSLTVSDPEKAREMVNRLSDFLRYALKQDALHLTTLEKELQAIRQYLEIEEVRFGNRLIYGFNLEEHHKKLSLPGLILQPLFENAVKHGLQQTSEMVHIGFEARDLDHETILEVRNRFDPTFGRFKGEGVGLENVRNRLRVHYGNGRLLRVEAREGMFTASLRLPKTAERQLT